MRPAWYSCADRRFVIRKRDQNRSKWRTGPARAQPEIIQVHGHDVRVDLYKHAANQKRVRHVSRERTIATRTRLCHEPVSMLSDTVEKREARVKALHQRRHELVKLKVVPNTFLVRVEIDCVERAEMRELCQFGPRRCLVGGDDVTVDWFFGIRGRGDEEILPRRLDDAYAWFLVPSVALHAAYCVRVRFDDDVHRGLVFLQGHIDLYKLQE